ARALALVPGELVDGRSKGFAALPGDRLPEGRVAGDLLEPGRLVRRGEDVEPCDGKAGAPHGEVPPQSPVTRQGDEGIVHAASLSPPIGNRVPPARTPAAAAVAQDDLLRPARAPPR